MRDTGFSCPKQYRLGETCMILNTQIARTRDAVTAAILAVRGYKVPAEHMRAIAEGLKSSRETEADHG